MGSREICVTAATGTAEREAALLLPALAAHAATVGGDKGLNVPSFVAGEQATVVCDPPVQLVPEQARFLRALAVAFDAASDRPQ